MNAFARGFARVFSGNFYPNRARIQQRAFELPDNLKKILEASEDYEGDFAPSELAAPFWVERDRDFAPSELVVHFWIEPEQGAKRGKSKKAHKVVLNDGR